MTAFMVSDWAALIIAISSLGTFALCLWAIPHHKHKRRDE